MRSKAKALGVKPIVIDARKEFAETWLPKAIRANSDYNGYPVSTSMTRQLVARIVAEKALELGCDGLMEGSTGKGNGPVPHAQCLQDVRPADGSPGAGARFRHDAREEKMLCEAWGVPVTEQITAATTRRSGAARSPPARWT